MDDDDILLVIREDGTKGVGVRENGREFFYESEELFNQVLSYVSVDLPVSLIRQSVVPDEGVEPSRHEDTAV